VTAVVSRRVTGHDAGIGRALSGVTALSLSLAVAYLGYQFATTDYTNGYVWAHTIDYLPLHYRLSGVFADVEGALLLWATGVSLVTFRTVSTTVDDRRTSAIGDVATAITAYFAVLVVTHSPFQPLELSTTTWITGPRGLNPLLVNPYMAVHPPITFAGYALTLPPFSIGVVHLVRRIRGESGLFEDRVEGVATWLRGAWVLLTASVTLGALWSYYTLGWGGLWAWDPVQTASLIAWVLVTAALHAIAEYRRDGTSSLLAVSLATLSFPTVVLVRVVTQSGVFTSVHSFGIDDDRLLVALFVVTFGLALGLSLVRWLQKTRTGRARRTTQTTQPRSATTTDSETDRGSRTSTLSYGVVLLLALVAIYAWGVFFPVASSVVLPTRVSFGVDFFNLWTYPLVVATLLSLGFYNDRRRSGNDGSGGSGDGNGDGGDVDGEDEDAYGAVTIRLGIVVVLTILVAVAPVPSWRFDPAETGFAYRVLGQLSTLSLVPPALYALGAELARFVPWPTNRPTEWSLPSIGTLLVHAGLVLLVLSVPFSYVAAGSGGVLGPVVADGGRSESTDAGYSMVVHEVTESTQSSGVSLTAAERRVLVDRVHEVGHRADALPETASGNVLVWGEITAVDRSGPTVTYRLGDAVWVAVDSVTTPDGDLDSTPAFEPGDTLYAQGALQTQTGTSGTALVETDSRFVGRDPVQAVLVDRQAVATRAKISVFDGDSRVARGWVGVRAGVTQGSIDVLVERQVLNDLYVVPQQIEPWEGSHLVVVTLERIPAMNGVRAGIWLLLLGGILRSWRSR
jgi:cytochrome c-type biogenesis protein CcmF